MTDFDEIVTKYYSAIIEFAKGNHHPMENIFSHTDEVTLANPFGSISHGWNEVNKTLELNAFYIKEGTNTIKNIVKIEN